ERLIFKLDSNCAFEWTYILEFTGFPDLSTIAEGLDGGLVAAGGQYVIKLDANGQRYNHVINGKVFFDEDALCATPDAGFNPLEAWLVKATSPIDTFSSFTDENGFFELEVDSNTYDLQTYPPSSYWQACSALEVISFASADTITQDFSIEQLVNCPLLETSISTPFLQRCFDNTYFVEVCNTGTLEAEAANVQVVLDPFLTYLSSTELPTSITGDTLWFDLDTLAFGECVSFNLLVNVDCSAVLGQTHCTSAHAFLANNCLPVDPLWDQSSTRVSATCETDLVRFLIENVGSGNMSLPRELRIVEDDLIILSEPYQLNAGETIERTVPANGSTWLLEAEQANAHPGVSRPSVTVEACVDAGLLFSTGFVTMFEQDDGDPHLDIDCQENIGSYDPNDKSADPKGYSSNHFIEANTDLEYRIRFQNTGTDTAFTVVVRDTLPEELDPETLIMEVSSHAYTYDIRNGNILIVTYNNIMLPDNNVNEPASNGFFKFRIQQHPDLPIGTRIENSAAIYFDFNEPIITNTEVHEIWDGLLPTNIEPAVTDVPNLEVRILPNPFREQTRIEVLGNRYTDLEFWVYDALGQRVDFKQFNAKQLDYQQNHLPEGIYVYEIRSNGQRLQSGKLVVQ
ncbi:MAG: T9SS type A sorting domain-containing protein, partial [Bacteroidota bacterium]